MVRFHLIKLNVIVMAVLGNNLLTLVMILVENCSVQCLFQRLVVALREEQHRFCGTFRCLQQPLKMKSIFHMFHSIR